MTIDIEFKCKKATVSGESWDAVSVEIESVEVSEVLDAIGEEKVFANIAVDDYIDWAEAAGHLEDILGRLDTDEVIAWLRSNGHLETES